MIVGMIGLGRMGFYMTERLLKHSKEVVVYNRSQNKVRPLVKKGAIGAKSFEDLVKKLDPKKRIIWLMLPAGEVTDKAIKQLLPLLHAGDILVNGANAFYKNAQEQNVLCKQYGVHLFDAGVSGGIWGLTRGYALMIGGPKKQFQYIEPFCKALAPERGYGYFGDVGMGHYVKSIHNIIEYVMMQGLAEGIELLNKKHIDYKKAAQVWQGASIVTSSLLDWMVDGFRRKDFKDLHTTIGSVTIEELTDTVRSVKGFAPAFDVARAIRLGNHTENFNLGKRVIAAMRREFGGHTVVKKDKR